jgi:hypothetical protein
MTFVLARKTIRIRSAIVAQLRSRLPLHDTRRAADKRNLARANTLQAIHERNACDARAGSLFKDQRW